MTSSGTASSEFSATSPSLIRRVAMRDPEAWRRFTRLYGPLVFHWCQQQRLSDHDAADVMQDVFVSVARAVSSYEDRPGCTFRGWLWTATRNQIVTFLRKQTRQGTADGGTKNWHRLLNIAESLSDDPDQFTSQFEIDALYRRGLELVRQEFRPRTWEIFWRNVVEDQPTDAVAKEFGISANSVRQTRSRILRRIRQELGDQSGFGTADA
ncbi:MAG: sigma-70 family RNA polymerase sigma factor [Planctomycetota bacterium]|nr:sigma-70 family RNA polymerase sigma factor [Planctomycetota bacterium]MDA1161156.1 sigma-70 family RNA polymerase sigma factor [Planctomycetota bacterium]